MAGYSQVVYVYKSSRPQDEDRRVIVTRVIDHEDLKSETKRVQETQIIDEMRSGPWTLLKRFVIHIEVGPATALLPGNIRTSPSRADLDVEKHCGSPLKRNSLRSFRFVSSVDADGLSGDNTETSVNDDWKSSRQALGGMSFRKYLDHREQALQLRRREVSELLLPIHLRAWDRTRAEGETPARACDREREEPDQGTMRLHPMRTRLQYALDPPYSCHSSHESVLGTGQHNMVNEPPGATYAATDSMPLKLTCPMGAVHTHNYSTPSFWRLCQIWLQQLSDRTSHVALRLSVLMVSWPVVVAQDVTSYGPNGSQTSSWTATDIVMLCMSALIVGFGCAWLRHQVKSRRGLDQPPDYYGSMASLLPFLWWYLQTIPEQTTELEKLLACGSIMIWLNFLVACCIRLRQIALFLAGSFVGGIGSYGSLILVLVQSGAANAEVIHRAKVSISFSAGLSVVSAWMWLLYTFQAYIEAWLMRARARNRCSEHAERPRRQMSGDGDLEAQVFGGGRGHIYRSRRGGEYDERGERL